MEWLFYQGVAWQKEQEEIIKYKNEKWFIYNKHDPKKLWKLLDWKGEVKTNTSCTPNVIHSYFEKKCFNSQKTKSNPTLVDTKHEFETYCISNDISDMQFVHSELDGAINDIGKGKSFDGLSGKVLQLTPPKLRECILKLLVTIFNNTYPSQWRTQLLFPSEKKGHKDNNPKLRGIAIGPLLSRLYDIIINKRFCSWYVPNPEQAGFREHHGCIVHIFALFLTMEMAKSLRKSLFIGLLDFVKAFDFMNRPTLMKDLMEQEIGYIFLRSLNKMYEEINK